MAPILASLTAASTLCAAASAQYVLKESGTCDYPIVSSSDCSAAAAALDLDDTTASSPEEMQAWLARSALPPYCFFDEYGALFFNADGAYYAECSTSERCLCRVSPASGECQAPQGIENAHAYPCSPPYIPSGGTCTPRCTIGMFPSLSSLNCSGGILDPPAFTCSPPALSQEFSLNEGDDWPPICDYHIVSLDQCSAAAAALGFPDAMAVEDGLSNSDFDPPFCYMNTATNAVLFNADGSNRGDCSSDRKCLCGVSVAPDWCPAPTSTYGTGDSSSARFWHVLSCNPPAIPSGGSCNPRCSRGQGRVPSVASLECSGGVLNPPNFTCEKEYDYIHDRDRTCDHHIVSLSECTAAAWMLHLYDHLDQTASEDGLSDSDSDPPFCYYDSENRQLRFNADGTNHGECSWQRTCWCRLSATPGWCQAPTGVAGASAYPCSPAAIESGRTCTPQCAFLRSPSQPSLTCANGTLIPATFTCEVDVVSSILLGIAAMFIIPCMVIMIRARGRIRRACRAARRIAANPIPPIKTSDESTEIGVCSAELPPYWTNDRKTSFDQMVYVKCDSDFIFNRLLADTYMPIVTQDRPCPKVNSPCKRQPGGCPCNQPGGNPGLPGAFVVRRVIRVEDSQLWQDYVDRRGAIMQSRSDDPPFHAFEPSVVTGDVVSQYTGTFQALHTASNEFYLWHGTSVRSALSIAQNDFTLDMAGSNAGTMYGRGIYLAESSTKADEYAQEGKGHYTGVHAMILCRVCLGKVYYTTARNPEVGVKVKAGEYDSVVGDRSKSAKTFREFVVYDVNQVYPEYVVLYSRAPSAEAVPEAALSRFHIQVPVYWNNCHMDPSSDPFMLTYSVRRKTHELLQRLVTGASKSNAKVLEAWRVEHSEMWSRYADFKAGLSAKGASYKAANELDGNLEQGHVLTHVLLQEMDGENAISTENLQEDINELVLWHGSSKEAISLISSGGFSIGKKTHGHRFGEGAYFAEDLDKSLSYASLEDGVHTVLLCRVACGDFHYTEKGSDGNAHKVAAESGKHTILANPGACGAPREYIALRGEQVYPEFILSLEV